MVSRPLADMTTAWQLGLHEWLMRDANEPCAHMSRVFGLVQHNPAYLE